MKGPDLTTAVMVCLGCHAWTVQTSQKARSELGGATGLAMAVAEVVNEHWHADHPTAVPLHPNGEPLEVNMSTGNPASGGVLGQALPRWWVEKS